MTAWQVKRAKDGDKLHDGRGLYLVVKGGSKAWVFRYEGLDAHGAIAAVRDFLAAAPADLD